MFYQNVLLFLCVLIIIECEIKLPETDAYKLFSERVKDRFLGHQLIFRSFLTGTGRAYWCFIISFEGFYLTLYKIYLTQHRCRILM